MISLKTGTGIFSHPYFSGFLLFFIFLLVGINVYQDYGVAWDEPLQRGPGLLSYNYIFKGNNELLTSPNDNHGTGFELLLIIIEKAMRLTDTRDIYLMRHLVTHIFFLLSALSFYFLVYRLFKNKWLASLGFLLVVIAPRIYAHSFFNSKDLPFLSMIIFSMALGNLAMQKNKPIWYFILGLACGYATSIRIMGVMVTLIFTLFLVFDFIITVYNKESKRAGIFGLGLFLGAALLMLLAGWPILWSSPVHNFIEGFKMMSHYTWGGSCLFIGKVLPSEHLPWYYIPVWFLISNPETFLLLGAFGVLVVLIDIIKKPIKFIIHTQNRIFLVALVLFIVPVLTIIGLHSVVYDDWRHLYFIYPPFLLLGLYGLNKVWLNKYSIILKVALLVQLVFTGITMISAHPFQQVYFNRVVSHEKDYLVKNYDFDYWGCGYKQALEYLYEHDAKLVINIAWTMNPLVNNLMILQKQDRKRFDMVEHNADYIITSYRGVNFGYFDTLNLVYSIKVMNSPVMGVYKLH